MFIDQIILTLGSGKGGQGCASFRREKFVPKGGPDGGDGGRGGDIWFVVDNNCDTLSHFQNKQALQAQNGRPGLPRNCSGKKGESLDVVVPPGTQVYDAQSGELLLDLTEEGERVKFLEGGKGGLGNVHFKSSSNQRPTYAQPGIPGMTRTVRLELKLIADVGLVGFPNVGKSTLIATLSNAKPQVADYEFTTLTPNLGVVGAGEYETFVMADIPGIIEGASDGKGLGLEFLRHIERTRMLLLMIDVANYRGITDQYDALKIELERYSEALAARPYAIALSRADALSDEEVNAKVLELMEHLGLPANRQMDRFGAMERFASYGAFEGGNPQFVLPISSVAKLNIRPLVFALKQALKAHA